LFKSFTGSYAASRNQHLFRWILARRLANDIGRRSCSNLPEIGTSLLLFNSFTGSYAASRNQHLFCWILARRLANDLGRRSSSNLPEKAQVFCCSTLLRVLPPLS
jgi:hypothetical protein